VGLQCRLEREPEEGRRAREALQGWPCPTGGVSRAQAASKVGGLQRAERKAAWSPGVTRGCHDNQEVAGEVTQSGGRAAYGTGGGEQRSRQEEEEKDWFANSENFRDPDVNQR